MLENQFRDKIKIAMKKCGPDLCWNKISDRFNAGIPDFLCCHRGTYIGIELKVDHRPVTPMQLYIAKQIVQAGGKFFVLRYKNDPQHTDCIEYGIEDETEKLIMEDTYTAANPEEIMIWLGFKDDRN